MHFPHFFPASFFEQNLHSFVIGFVVVVTLVASVVAAVVPVLSLAFSPPSLPATSIARRGVNHGTEKNGRIATFVTYGVNSFHSFTFLNPSPTFPWPQEQTRDPEGRIRFVSYSQFELCSHWRADSTIEGNASIHQLNPLLSVITQSSGRQVGTLPVMTAM
jgi:hypothetical protein